MNAPKMSDEIRRVLDEGDLKELLQMPGFTVQCWDVNGMGPLHYAAWKGYPHLVGPLLASGADVNATANNGGTPAHTAAFCGHDDVLQLLLDAGAALSPLSEDGDTPLDCAITMDKRGAAQLLLARGARPNKKELPDWLQVWGNLVDLLVTAFIGFDCVRIFMDLAG